MALRSHTTFNLEFKSFIFNFAQTSSLSLSLSLSLGPQIQPTIASQPQLCFMVQVGLYFFLLNLLIAYSSSSDARWPSDSQNVMLLLLLLMLAAENLPKQTLSCANVNTLVVQKSS